MLSCIRRRFMASAMCLCTLAFASFANAQLINEFEPNPPGTDPSPTSVEILGTPNSSFTGVLIARETDDATGSLNSVDAVSGTFDANGLLVVMVPDFENPSFELILVDAFTGVAGSNTVFSLADLQALGTTVVYDAISIPDATGDEANAIAVSLGGTSFTYTGDEPQVVFRDGLNPSVIYAVNDPAGTDAFDQNGNLYPLATAFSIVGGGPIDLTAGPFSTYGSANYTAGGEASGSCSGLTPAPACIITTESNCTTLGGSFVENGSCPQGRCDLPGGSCIETTEEDCLSQGGTYGGNGVLCPLGASDLLINEIDADQLGTDAAEFIELYNSGPSTIDFAVSPHVLVLFNGNGDVSYQAYDLTGSVPSGGYYVVGTDAVVTGGVNGLAVCSACTNLIQNGPDAVALYTGTSASFPNGTAVTTASLVDAAVYGSSSPDDAELLAVLTPGQPQLDEDNGAADADTESLQRCGDGNGGALVTTFYGNGTPTPGAANNCDVVGLQGACILNGTTCEIQTGSDCSIAGGTYLGDGTLCSDVGACTVGGVCTLNDEAGCMNAGGSFGGAGTVCTGACCNGITQACINDVTAAECSGTFDIFLGPNSDCTGGCPSEPMGIVLNEVRRDQSGTDGDYIELAGPANADLSGLSIVIVGDGAAIDGGGVVEQVISLAGASMGADGIFLIADPATITVGFDQIDLPISGFTIENGDNKTFILAYTVSAQVNDDLDLNDDCFIDEPAPWIADLDRVALIIARNDSLGSNVCHYATTSGGMGGGGCPACLGDFDSSGARDLGDVAGFVNALLNTGDACADIDMSGTANGLDIAGFVQLVLGTTPCPGGGVSEVESQIVGPDGIFAAAHGFRIENETGAWRLGNFDPNLSFDTAGTVNTAPVGACCLEASCIETNRFLCDDQGGLFRGDGTTCATMGICDCSTIDDAKIATSGLGFIICDVTVVETVDNDTDSDDDRVFTIQDESGSVITGPGGTTRGLSVVFDEIANPALGTFVDTLTEGTCINVIGTTETIANGLYIRIDSVNDIEVNAGGCPAINVPVVSPADFDSVSASAEDLESVRVELPCVAFIQSGTFASSTSYSVTDGISNVAIRINTAAGAAMPIIGTPIPAGAVGIEGIFHQFASTYQLRLHESDDLLAPNCPGGVGACCLSTGECVQADFSICVSGAIGGTFVGGSCEPNPCSAETGACCVEGVCTEGVTQLACEGQGGAYLGDNTTCPMGGCPDPTAVVLNEIRIDDVGTDDSEYIELRGNPGTPLGTLTIIVIGDGTGGSGVIEDVFDLTGQSIPADGYFVIAYDTFDTATLGSGLVDLELPAVGGGDLENSDNLTFLLVQDFSGANGDDLDTNDDCVLDATPWGLEVDRVALVEELNPPVNTECHYGDFLAGTAVGPDGTFVPGQVYRCDDDPMGPWFVGDFTLGVTDTPGAPNACLAGACCNGSMCTITVEDDCVNGGGSFIGSGVPCSPDPCGATGACCNQSTFECENLTAAQCASFGDRTYLGDGTSCAVDCSVETTTLVPCTAGLDCTVADVNGVCVFTPTFNDVPGNDDCNPFEVPNIEVACSGSCDLINPVVFFVPASGFGGGLPATDCLFEAQGIDVGNGSNCNPVGSSGGPIFEVAP